MRARRRHLVRHGTKRRRLIRNIVLATVAGAMLLTTVPVVVFRFVPPPFTPLMLRRSFENPWPDDRGPISKSWTAYEDISVNVVRAVLAAEDTRFCQHYGFDWGAIRRALRHNADGGRPRGASTISMQTAKNMFLWPERSYLRKALEAYFTVLIELVWPKQRILVIYLNIVEWDEGIYGIEAAARFHFGKSAAILSKREASLLAAVLPNPRVYSASAPTGYIRNRARIIRRRMADVRIGATELCP